MTRMPTAADEARFWELVESAWQRVGPEGDDRRAAVAKGEDPDSIEEHLESFLEHLGALSADLSADELTDLDRVVERKLHDIDRADIHAVADGSPDAFLYTRGFIVALGKDFYDAVHADPERAIAGGRCEDLCYFFAHLYYERFDESWPETGSGISRESGRNDAGWS